MAIVIKNIQGWPYQVEVPDPVMPSAPEDLADYAEDYPYESRDELVQDIIRALHTNPWDNQDDLAQD